MDVTRFDALTRAFSTPRSRRVTLGSILASLLAPLGTRAAPKSAGCIHTGHICGKRRKRGGKNRRGKNGRGKRRRRPSSRPCTECCTRFATRTSKRTRRCSCKPEGTRCGNRTQCCSGRCQGGVCTTCQAGTTFCAGGCVNSQTDRNNCGTCGHACAAGEKCQTGTCVADCDVCAEGCDFDSVAAAVAMADAGATIRICPGTYTGRATFDKSLTLIGAGASETTLTGGGTATGQPVLRIRSGTIVVQALTVTGGNNSVSGGGDGGGIGNYGTLTLAGVIVTGNTAEVGGGVYNEGSLTLERSSSVAANAGTLVAGGIYNRSDGGDGGGTVVIDGSSVSGNLTGGGIYNDNFSTLTIIDGSTVAGNTTSENGGGIANYAGAVTIEDSTVTGNTAGGTGGGIHNDAGEQNTQWGTVRINSGSSVTGNNADPTNADSGGGIFNVPGAFGFVILDASNIVTGNFPDNCGGQHGPNCVD